ncbi:DUF6961 family protein [Croceibacterium soli]
MRAQSGSAEQEVWAVALWVEKQHGADGLPCRRADWVPCS